MRLLQRDTWFRRFVGLVILLEVCVIARGVDFAGGSGEPSDPYLIATPEQMNAIGADPNLWGRHFRLVADIDLSQYGQDHFNMIGYNLSYNDREPFSGVFDGDGRTIANLHLARSNVNRVGLFGYVFEGTIQDLKLVDPNVGSEGGNDVGALVGMAHRTTIANCSVEGGSVRGRRNVGGLVGNANDANILFCSCSGTVQGDVSVGGLIGGVAEGFVVSCHFDGVATGQRFVGGLLGSGSGTIGSCSATGHATAEENVGGLVGANHATIRSCYSTVTVRGNRQCCGGLVGANWQTLVACWASGEVSGNVSVGGLVGVNSGTVSHCYASGAVQGLSSIAGFVGNNGGRISLSYSTGSVVGNARTAGFTAGGSVYLCYWDTQASGVEGDSVGRGRTTKQMQSASTYRGWGYGSHWVLDEGNAYPSLAWEKKPGQLLADEPSIYDGGSGQVDDPYRIATAQQFISIAYHREDLDKHFILVNDIDLGLAQEEPLPIGMPGMSFTGSFQGDGHSISHFQYLCRGQSYVGLFGYVERDVLIADINLIDVIVSGGQYTGGLAGYSLGTIERCSVAGIVSGTDRVGGLVGSSWGTIVSCFSTGDVEGESVTGGLVGYNNGDSEMSYSSVSVSGGECVGGLVGINGRRSLSQGHASAPTGCIPSPPQQLITACYCIGSVSGHHTVGGLVGRNSGLIVASYAAAPVVGASIDLPPDRSGRPASVEEPVAIGGFVGSSDFGTTLQGFWDVEVAGLSTSAEGLRRTSTQMVDSWTFRGWAYLNRWLIKDGQAYPCLAWQEQPGEPLVSAPDRYNGGTGEPDDPYQIASWVDWVDLGTYAEDWDKCFVLIQDIDLAAVDSNELGPVGVYGIPFLGVFDGNNHTISNYTYDAKTGSCIGLFGSIGSESMFWRGQKRIHDVNGVVRNLHLDNVDVSAFGYAGGLAGFNGGAVSGCSVTGRVVVLENDAGGLFGASIGSVSSCSAICDVEAGKVAGGLIGWSMGPVSDCWAEGNVRADSMYAGGLIGESLNTVQSCHFSGAVAGGYYVGGLVGHNSRDGGRIRGCFATGGVVGTHQVGGLVGQNGYTRLDDNVSRSFTRTSVAGEERVGGLIGSNGGQVANCYAEGAVKGTKNVAGLAGDNTRTLAFCFSACTVSGQQGTAGLAGRSHWGDIDFCLWDTTVSGSNIAVADYVSEPENVWGLATGMMQKAAPFIDAGWDFETVWTIREDQDYPRLRWEQTLGQD